MSKTLFFALVYTQLAVFTTAGVIKREEYIFTNDIESRNPGVYHDTHDLRDDDGNLDNTTNISIIRYIRSAKPDDKLHENTEIDNPPGNEIKKDLESSMSYCEKLDKKYSDERGNLSVRYYGELRHLVVLSSSRAPGQATAALIAAALRYRIGYEVSTRIDNRTVCELATTLPDFKISTEFIIHVDADWEGPEEKCPPLPRCSDGSFTCSIAGTRLLDIGAAQAVNARLYAAMATASINDSACKNSDSWPFYQNRRTLEECGFRIANNGNATCIPVLILPEGAQLKLEEIDENISFCYQNISNRTELWRKLDNNSTSFLFVDYELHDDLDRVRVVQLPTRLTPSKIALRVADYYVFNKFAPQIVSVLNTTSPSRKEIRQILDINTTTQDIDEAVCTWAGKSSNFEEWTQTFVPRQVIKSIFCKNDTDLNEYRKLLNDVYNILDKTITDIFFKFTYILINCSDVSAISQQLTQLPWSASWHRVAGITALGNSAEAGVQTARTNVETQLLLYDVPPTRARLHAAAGSSSGNLMSLAGAIRYFFVQHGWRRVGIISESTNLAEDLSAELRKDKTFIYKEKTLKKEDEEDIARALQSLREDNAHIIFINTRPKTANLIICEAVKLDMNIDSEYAWIAREWRWLPTKECETNIRVFTVSYWWRGGNTSLIDNAGGDKMIRSTFDLRWGLGSWPPYAAPLTDAILLIAHRLATLIRKHPEQRYDYHGPGSTRLLAEQLNGNETIAGVVQPLQLRNYTRENPLVFVTAWTKNISDILAVWQANSGTHKISEFKVVKNAYGNEKPPHDGSFTCKTTLTGDPFNPNCGDPIWACGGVILILAPIALWAIRRARLKNLQQREKDTLMRLLARCERTAAILSPHLIDRSALELQEELGSGHFGRVRFGLLRLPNRKIAPVGAKALRKDAAPAEEAEFLREASTLATLSHAHVVRLVGVCADIEGPPLLLMEHAFFGDLLHYLRARRHLAEWNDIDETTHNLDTPPTSRCQDQEACFVSPMELTRLTCEAAEALSYLNEQRTLHRDVRAANCLVDAHRALKLADFGMARSVGASKKSTEPEDPMSGESDYKYICRRRGVFPVPWMAPESLDHGEFSHASDVWALGVLLLEVATLGARPYGAWKPLRVLRYVRGGGRPPLPIDASYHMCEVTEMCWARSPQKRATAKEVSDYLSAHTTAVKPALRPAWHDPELSPEGSDSGFGEREADPDWTNAADLRVSTL